MEHLKVGTYVSWNRQHSPTILHQEILTHWLPVTEFIYCILMLHLDSQSIDNSNEYFPSSTCTDMHQERCSKSRALVTLMRSCALSSSIFQLLNDAVYLRIFIYKGTKKKLSSVCRAHQIQSNGPTLRSPANFNIEFEQFCCSITVALACLLSIEFYK